MGGSGLQVAFTHDEQEVRLQSYIRPVVQADRSPLALMAIR
jgi:hypothetical protein